MEGDKLLKFMAFIFLYPYHHHHHQHERYGLHYRANVSVLSPLPIQSTPCQIPHRRVLVTISLLGILELLLPKYCPYVGYAVA